MNLDQIFNEFNNQEILVVGDVMIDAYLWGTVNRISPEAPVPVVSVTKKESRLGGAANVGLNIIALGAKPILCGIIGNDDSGKNFCSLLQKRNMTDSGMIVLGNRPTTVKTRILGSNQQMLRVDEEITDFISIEAETKIISKIEHLVNNGSIKAIILEDYNKGMLTEKVISSVIEIANKNNIPVSVDPKKENFFAYKNTTLFKPNLKELKEGLKEELNEVNQNNLDVLVNKLESSLLNEISLITLSEYGVYVKEKGISEIIPAHKRKIVDVSGAGDSVISVASLCLALGLNAKLTAELSNLAGGLVCEKVGVVPIDKNQLLEEARKTIK